jgi:hypothetical protein
MAFARRTEAKMLAGHGPVRWRILHVGISNKRFLMPYGQLQLGFDNLPCSGPPRSRARQLSRADWWFGQMRQAVEQPFDWPTPPQPRRRRAWMPDEAEPQVPG